MIKKRTIELSRFSYRKQERSRSILLESDKDETTKNLIWTITVGCDSHVARIKTTKSQWTKSVMDLLFQERNSIYMNT